MSNSVEPKNAASSSEERPEPWLPIVAEKIRTLRYGTVQIKVHDSQVVLIERSEQTRFDPLIGSRRV